MSKSENGKKQDGNKQKSSKKLLCPRCKHPVIKHGFSDSGTQRYGHSSPRKKKCKWVGASPIGLEPAEPHQHFNAWFVGEFKAILKLARPPESIEDFQLTLQKKLPEYLKKNHKDDVTRGRIFDSLDELFNKPLEPMFRDAAKARMSPANLYKLVKEHTLSNELCPPEWWVEWRLKEMRGLTEAPRPEIVTQRGINMIDFTGARSRTLPKTSFAKPYAAHFPNESSEPRVMVLSGLQMGLHYDPDIERNLTRCAFVAARELGCDAMFLSGGLFRIMFQKTAGPTRLIQDLLSGIAIDWKSIAADYREEAKQIQESGSFEPIYTIGIERFEDVLRGYRKVAVRPNGTPEFPGPVYIMLSPDDLGLVRGITYAYLSYRKYERYLRAEADASLAARIARKALKNLSKAERDGMYVDEMREKYESARKEAERTSLLASRIRMTNLESRQNIRIYKKALSYLIGRLEEMIPNSKVIGQNGMYVRFGASAQVAQFISSSDKSIFTKLVRDFGQDARDGTVADITVGMYPGTLGMTKTSRDRYRGGSMTKVMAASFVEAPILVDKAPIMDELHGVKVNLPVVQAVKDSTFAPGALVVKFGAGRMPESNSWPAEAIRQLGGLRKRKYVPEQYVNILLTTDPHLGGQNRLWMSRDTGHPVAVTEAGLELLARGIGDDGLAPVHMNFWCDDLTQGNHFGTHLRPHHNQRSFADILNTDVERAREIMAMRSAERQADTWQEMYFDAVEQLKIRPPHHFGSQLTEFWEAIFQPKHNQRFFKGVLMRARKSGLVIRGPSSIVGSSSDMRDVGFINFGSGNHAGKTVDNHLYEGVLAAEHLRALLSNDPQMEGYELKKLIAAPLFQDQSIGYGLLRVGEKGFTWGISVANTPPKRTSWERTMRGWVDGERRGGNPSSMLENVPILYMAGDKHFFGVEVTRGGIYVMGPSSTHTDAFAHIAGDLPPNNTGFAFVRLPVRGPDYGDVQTIHLTPTTMHEYILNPERKFPWGDFLPNSV